MIVSKKILVACGTGAATSTLVASKVREALAKHGVSVEVSQCKLMELESVVPQTRPDLVVVTGVAKSDQIAGVPVVRGFSFLTGVGVDRTVSEILSHL